MVEVAERLAAEGGALVQEGREREALGAFELAGEILAVSEVLGGPPWSS